MKQILVTTTQLKKQNSASHFKSLRTLVQILIPPPQKSPPSWLSKKSRPCVSLYFYHRNRIPRHFSFDLPMLKCSRVPKSPLTYNSLSSRPCLAPAHLSFHYISFHSIEEAGSFVLRVAPSLHTGGAIQRSSVSAANGQWDPKAR